MKTPNFFSKLPSIVWVILIPLGIALFIGSIIFLFSAMATVEGVGSLIVIVVGALTFYSLTATTGFSEKMPGYVVAIGITFFALMGMAIDQPGNLIFNKPFELFCDNGSKLTRTVEILHPLPGRTDIIQDFSCIDAQGKVVDRVNAGEMLIVRFVEYVLIGYILLYASKFIHSRRFPKQVI